MTPSVSVGHVRGLIAPVFLSILCVSINGVFIMRPVSRRGVSKRASARSFRRQSMRTKAPNMAKAPMRGGWRL